VFLENVNQTTLVGATGTGGSTATTAETAPLSNSNGDMAIVAGTCGNDAAYSTINSFIEAIEMVPLSADGIGGYLACTGVDVTPGISHTNVNRHSVIGFVLQAGFAGSSDTDPPTPNPATFASAPSADSSSAISMTATTGSDASGPVEYLFTETSGNPGGTSSAWQTSTSYTDSGLDADTQYTYTVTMRDSIPNTGTASAPANATTDPSGGSYCTSSGSTADENIAEVHFGTFSNTSSDLAAYTDFTSLTVNAQLNNSYDVTLVQGNGAWDQYWTIWIDFNHDNDFTDAGEEFFIGSGTGTVLGSVTIPASAQLGDTRMRVAMKYGAQATSCEDFSYGEVEDYTINISAGGGDTDPPTPNPATFASAPSADSSSAISMTANTGSDASGPVQYYFDETTGGPGADDSGWQTSTSYTDSGLDVSTQYTYTVTMRDDLGNTGIASGGASATTNASSNQAPWFTTDPIIEIDATQDAAYSSTIADDASDLESDPMTFSKVSGPAWLTVASDGTLSGTPTNGDVGLNVFIVQVNATGGADSATLNITVNATATWTQVLYDDFENGYVYWTDGGSDCKLYTDGTYAHQGSNALNLEDNTSTSVTTTSNLDLSAYSEIKVDFAYMCVSMDNSDEDFWLQISTNGGANFTTVEEWNEGDEFENLNFYSDSVTITGYTLTNQTQIRFRCDASGGADDVYLDEILISAGGGGGGPDTDPPTPNPATFASAPAAISSSAISMTATTGSDASGPVQYYFDETSGNPGGSDSGWQTSASYTDSGLNASTQYTYTIQMRDSLSNTGTASSPANATTQAGGGSWIKVDDRDGSVTYSGSTWYQTSPSTAYMNTATFTSNTGISATYSFTGTQVRFYVWQYNTSQGYDVYIDEQFQQTVNVGSGLEASIQAWESGTLANTAHTLRLQTASGEPHVDAFEHFGN